MIVIAIRLILLAAVVIALYLLLKKLFVPSDFKACGRCEGKGYWYAARGRETCDWCNGSGKLPRKTID